MEFVSLGRPIKELSRDELREYACEHVLYEITHFVRATQAVAAANAGTFELNFAIELFALHLRNLLDFFAPRKVRPTDACAHHFFDGWEPPTLNLYLREARGMADKQIMHLTTGRTDDPDLKTWVAGPIVASLKPIIERFAEGADLVCASFQKDVDAVLSELPRHSAIATIPPLEAP